MLTIFKPWRSGKDLKGEKDTWDESFLNFQFTDTQKQVMKNFNLCYECLDAHDDHRAALKKGTKKEVLPGWNTYELDDTDEWNGNTDDIDEEYENDPMFQGHYEKSRQAQMLQMMNIMVNIGWTKEIVNETNLNACSESSQPKKTMTANEWRAEVQKKKQAELDCRSQHIPSTTEENSNETGIHTSNKVFIADKSYIDKDKRHTEKNQ